MRGTHILETTEGRTCQDVEGKQPSKEHSLPGDHRGRDLSGHGKKVTKQGALTSWRPQREELVRIQKEINQARGTHSLETTEGGTCQDTERRQPSKGHLHTRDHRGRDLSGHRKKATKQGALTCWRPQREGLVRIQKESNQERGTHCLETTEGGTCQDTERKQPSKGHSPTGDHRGRDLSAYEKKATKRGTHFLKTTEGRTCQNTEREQPSKGYSHPGEYRQKGKSEHGKKVQEQQEGNNRNYCMEYGVARTD